MANDGNDRRDLSHSGGRKPAPHGAEAQPEEGVRVPAPHGALQQSSDRIAGQYKRTRKGGKVFKEIQPNPVIAAEAVTSIDETWDENQGKYVKRNKAGAQNKVQSSRMCFIATAAYGDIDAPEVEQLREFRDNSLMTNSFGRSFVRAYYTVSPPIARLIARKPTLRLVARKVLDVLRNKAAL